MPVHPTSKRILLLGGTGTIGQASAKTLVQRGHDVVCVVRSRPDKAGVRAISDVKSSLPGCDVRIADVTDFNSLLADGCPDDSFDTLISCLASRTGTRDDAFRVDYQANQNALKVAQRRNIPQMILLSAICVQRPKLAFQEAKLAFEKELIASGINYSIVRPTAFFKSLSGQLKRVQSGKPYLLFGDGKLTACKPISDNDLAAFLSDCVENEDLQNKILPIGGPGPAITPREQGEFLFSLLDEPPRFRSVSPRFLQLIGQVLSVAARLYPPLAARAEYARIGHYYATESMLVWDPEAGAYSEALTPSFGDETLFDHYRELWHQSKTGP